VDAVFEPGSFSTVYADCRRLSLQIQNTRAAIIAVAAIEPMTGPATQALLLEGVGVGVAVEMVDGVDGGRRVGALEEPNALEKYKTG
jgi:hypothetical protein